jgi:hypothetical protein
MSIIEVRECAIIYTRIVRTIDNIEDMKVEKNRIIANKRSNLKYINIIAANIKMLKAVLE